MLEREQDKTQPTRARSWLLGGALLAVIGAVLAVVGLFGGATLPDRAGPPVEELVVERTVFTPGTIELTVRGAGPDPVAVAQVAVNDSFTEFRGAEQPIGRLQPATLSIAYPWVGGQPYLISLLTSTGAVIEHEVPVAVATPPVVGSLQTMILLGLYVGVLPVVLGMFVLPLLRRAGPTVTRLLLAFTIGLLGFIAVEAALEGIELAGRAGGPFGGVALVFLTAAATFVVLNGVNRWVRARRPAQERGGRRAALRLATLVAGGIGLHNLGEGLAIGSAFAVGELAVGAALVIGLAVHNTTEGLAIVAPLVEHRAGWLRLLGLGLLAGAPAIVGAVVGVAVDSPTLSAALLSVGVGAIALVVVQVAEPLRDKATGRIVDPPVAVGDVVGLAVMYLTGLLVVG
ncbi:ZIP family metal transporter [Pseudonocardia sp. D17]|uniref:ZIP family metal transporter n=1 Tax=Pseudonocardia sp. D17 TaxID=882661 RepID=UPI002B386135|nr:metal transporter [Pseudonocardia sp. D17]